LIPLLNHGVENLPSLGDRTVPLYIMATAGMRDNDNGIPKSSKDTMRCAWDAIHSLGQAPFGDGDNNPMVQRRKIYKIGDGIHFVSSCFLVWRDFVNRFGNDLPPSRTSLVKNILHFRCLDLLLNVRNPCLVRFTRTFFFQSAYPVEA